jgi:hypothetical protein
MIIIIIIGIFGLLATEIIDFRPNDSKSVRVYEDLKQRQNEWIAENCLKSDTMHSNPESCNDGKTVSEKINEFIEINKNYFDSNGFNMYGFDKNGLDKHGRTISQGKTVSDVYKQCISSKTFMEKCESEDGQFCVTNNESRVYAYCNEQSRLMNEQFLQKNNP